MRISTALVDAESSALEAISELLDRPNNRKGLTAQQIAEGTGLAIGRVEEVLHKSKLVLKRRCHNRRLWWNDWEDVEAKYRPQRKRGRPKTK